MTLYILLFISIIIITVLVYFLFKKETSSNSFVLGKANQARDDKKNNAKDSILKLFETQEKINNNDVQKLLSVSDATATRYLEELEKEGKILQREKIGKWVVYTRI